MFIQGSFDNHADRLLGSTCGLLALIYIFQFQSHSLTEENVVSIGAKAEGYSGADMATLCKEAAMGPIRSLDYSRIYEVVIF